MLWVSKVKEGAKEVLKEHPVSVWTFFVSCVLLGILSYSYELKFSNTVKDILTFIRYFLLSVTAVFFLCESNFIYRKSIGKIESLKDINRSFVYAVVLAIGIFMSVVFALFQVKFFMGNSGKLLGLPMYDAEEFFLRFFYVYLVVCASSGIFFLYKRCQVSFENYCVKGFLGIMKGYLAYGVILLGALCIVWVFSMLIKDIDAVEFVMAFISGLMAYSTILMALSKPSENITKFGNIMMGYVFPGILAVAFVIVYVYIIKILITWTFPSNEAFAIVTALFASGICIWTMAQGCAEGGHLKALRIFPLLFIPFIFIQVMCLYMRIHQYGLTQSRYLGVALIVFEVMYELYYIVRLALGMGLGAVLFPVLIAFSIVILLIPGVNMFSSVTRSQKRIVNKVIVGLDSDSEADSKDIARARSALKAIERDGGFEGERYLRKLYEKYGKDAVNEYLGREDEYSYEEHKRFSGEHDWDAIDVVGFSKMSEVELYLYSEDIDPKNIELVRESITGDLSGLITEMEKLYDKDADNRDFDALVSKPIKFGDGSLLYISYISVEEDEFGKISDLNLRGYYLY